MLYEILKKLNVYRKEITEFVPYETIEAKEKELGIVFPEAFKEFYHYYGNDMIVKRQEYLFDDIDSVKIEDNILCFGYYNQGGERIGIKLEKMGKKKLSSVSFRSEDDLRWYSEEIADSIFFFRVVSWHLLLSMQGVARTEMDDKQFESLLGIGYDYLCDQEFFLFSPVIPVITDKILGCYFVRDGLLYLGTNEEDEILNEFEEKYDLDLDWL